MPSNSIRFKIYAATFALVVAIDAARFFVFQKEGLISWNTIHGGWVGFGACLMLLAAFIKHNFFKYLGLGIYALIFVASLINQIFPFNSVTNYYCMLFNLGLFTVYYFNVSSGQ